MTNKLPLILAAAALSGIFGTAAAAQQGVPPGPVAPTPAVQVNPAVVARIALFPDPLLTQLLTASMHPDQIAAADAWAHSHANLQGEQLVRALAQDNPPWDPSIKALLPFPAVLDGMAGDMNWTSTLGGVVAGGRPAAMAAIQNLRQIAASYGFLGTATQYRLVTPGPGEIDIVPTDPNRIYVPYYDPAVVFNRPPPGFVLAGAVNFGPPASLLLRSGTLPEPRRGGEKKVDFPAGRGPQ